MTVIAVGWSDPLACATTPISACKQRAGHTVWLAAYDKSSGDTHCQDCEVYQVGWIALIANDADGKDCPDQEKRCRYRDGSRDSVHQVRCIPYQAGKG